jgi:hypothetical protein
MVYVHLCFALVCVVCGDSVTECITVRMEIIVWGL